jgi:hypothetical protein
MSAGPDLEQRYRRVLRLLPEEQRRQLRQDYILLRVAAVCAVGLVTAFLVLCLIMIATHV